MRSTPATRAGTTVMTSDDGYGADPPGTYAPTDASASQRRSIWMPGAIAVVVDVGRCVSAKRVTLAMA
jgi:hypothetical protein